MPTDIQHQPTIEPVHTRVQPAPPTAATASSPSPAPTPSPIAAALAHEQQKADQPKATKPQKPANNGVGLAIVATVIIVLGLACLAVFAYIKTKK
jgi:hypothetical protein